MQHRALSSAMSPSGTSQAPGRSVQKSAMLAGMSFDQQASALTPRESQSPVQMHVGKAVQRKEAGPSQEDLDRSFYAWWKELGGKGDKVQAAVDIVRKRVGPSFPADYVPPPWRQGAAPDTSNQTSTPSAASPIGDGGNMSMDPNAQAAAAQNTANDEYATCTGNGGDPLTCADQVTQGGGVAPDLAGGQSLDPNAGHSGGQPSGQANSPTSQGAGAASAGLVDDGQSGSTTGFEVKPGDTAFEFTADNGGFSGRLSYSKEVDKVVPIATGVFLKLAISQKYSGGVEKRDGGWSGNLGVEIAGSADVNFGVEAASAYAGGIVRVKGSGCKVSRSEGGDWGFDAIDPVSLTVQVVAGVQVKHLGKIEHSPGGEYELAQLTYDGGFHIVAGKDVERLRADATSVYQAMSKALDGMTDFDAAMKRMDQQARDPQNPPGKL